jgi:uncharacterized protein with HEPN domain
MTRRSEREWLSDIVSWGERLQEHLAGIDRKTFFADKLKQDAVSKCVEAIGEAARLPASLTISIRNWTGSFPISI